MKTEEILQENSVADVATHPETPSGEAAEASEEGAAVEEETAAPVEEAQAVTETAPQPEEPAAVSAVPAEEVERLVAEAYRRGRNESIAELMARPGMFEAPAAPPKAGISSADSGFLANRRPSIWDQ